MTMTKRRTSNEGSNPSKDLTETVEKRLQTLLKDGANAAVDWEWTCPELPPYYDPEKFYLGQKSFYDNVFAMMVAKLAGLVTLLSVPTILDVIIFTKQSGTPCTAFRRYVSTIFHTFVWYEKKPIVQNEFLESLKIVRKKHCVAFRKSAEVTLHRTSQLDMALAQFGFIGYILLCEEQLGIVFSHGEQEGLVHLWRVVGYMLGMDDKYNLCTGSVEETRALCRRVLDDVFLPALAKSQKNFDDMGRILLEGLWPVNPMIDREGFIAYTLHLASSAATNNNHSIEMDINRLSSFARFTFKLQSFVHRHLLQPTYWWSSLFRAFFNSQMRLAIFLTEKFPFLAYWSFGVNRSHVNIFKYSVNNIN